MIINKLSIALFLMLTANIAVSQVSTFPYSESFEQTFKTGENISFIPNWTGNNVKPTRSRIFKSTDGRTGSASLNVIPTSSFSAEMRISLNLTGISNPKMNFYAFSKKNGRSSSSRPALVSLATSIDGGTTFLDNVKIGDATTFPNNNSTRYTRYAYELPAAASGQSHVVIKMTVARGSGSGSAAQFVMDDVSIEQQLVSLPLAIQSIKANSATELALTFNQEVERVSAENPSNYALDFSFGSPATAVLSGTNAAVVTLSFAKSMVNNSYQLTINGVRNSSGNARANGLTSTVTFRTATLSRQIVINEIYADPRGANQPKPQVLPGSTNDEFIELYNASSKAINLANFELSGGTIGNHVLAPGAFVILTSGGNVSNFDTFGNTVAVSSWNAMSNSGERIVLKDNLGNIVDSLTYNLTWYQDPEKADGGWSLEQINPELTCSDANNWKASTDAKGGSPGSQNAVYDNSPDIIGPNLVSVRALSQTSLLVTFNEIMDQSSLSNGTFTLDKGLTVASSSPVLPGLKTTTLTLAGAMTSGTVYQLRVKGVTDCSGNAVANGNLSFLFDNEPPVFERFVVKDLKTVDLIFNEVLDEKTAETKTNYSVAPQIGNPQHASRSSGDKKRVRLSFRQNLSEAIPYVFSYEKLADRLGNTVISSAETLRFTNAIDKIVVNSSQLLDVYFTEPIEKAAAENTAHYRVDRGIGSPKTALQDRKDNQLVHLVFENSFDENRNLNMGFENIKNSGGNFVQALNTAFAYDTDPPGIDSVKAIDQSKLMVYFDEAVDLNTAEAINHYLANHNLGNPTKAKRQADMKSVQLTFSGKFTHEQVHTLSVSGIRDLAQNQLSRTRYIKFTFDELPPRLLAVKVLSPTELLVTFSEVVMRKMAEKLSTYHIDNGIGKPEKATRNARDSSRVNLVFSGFGNHAANTLTINGIKDLKGNVSATDLTGNFSSDQPAIGSLHALTDTTLLLTATKKLSRTSAESPDNYALNNGLGVKSASQDANNHQVVLTLTGSMVEDTGYALSISSLTDTDGNTNKHLATRLTYDTQLAGLVLVNRNTLKLQFDHQLLEAHAETAGNFKVSNGIGHPVSVVLDNEASKIITLIFGTQLVEDRPYSLHISGLKDSFRDDIPASSHTLVYDVTAPTIASVRSTFTNQITVTFSEPLDKTSAETLNHFSLNQGMGHPAALEWQNGGKEVLLTFSADLTDATTYQLTADRVKDLHGNAISAATINFTFSAPVNPGFRELVINEIYPAPDANSPLPKAEFIEIYNAGTRAIKMRNFTLSDNRSVARLSHFELAAHDYLILTSNAHKSLFSGNVMGLSGFPSLSNAGETLYFKRRDGRVIDSLSYNLKFYQDNGKEDRGFTIELINPAAPCFDPANYAASTAAKQGTPGAQNSVFDNSADTTAPELISVEMTGDRQFQVVFNESMDVGSMEASDFTFSNGLKASSVSPLDDFGTKVRVKVNANIPRGTGFKMTIARVNDCSGNQITPVSKAFVLGGTPSPGQLVITEIMANPSPGRGLPEADYLEILNVSNITLSLQGLTLSDRSTSTLPGNIDIGPGEYQVLTTHKGASQIPGARGVSGFPSLNSSGDLVAISRGSTLIASVTYSDDWFRDRAKAQGGVSLEMIDTNFPCLEAVNWRGSKAPDGGTPGRVNSVNGSNPDVTGPKLLQAVALNTQQILLTYDEKLSVETITTNTFQISTGITAHHFFWDQTQRKITLTTHESLQSNTLYTITTENISDCSGNLIQAGFDTKTLVLAPEGEKNDLLINEILFNPRRGGVRFVEVYNHSTKFLNLKNWVLAGATHKKLMSEEERIVAPGSYLVLTTDGAILAREYPVTVKKAVFEMPSLPSFANSSGTVSIFNPKGEMIDLFNYSADFHSSLLDNVKGVSLERIRFAAAGNDPNNWHSAASTAGYATPGYANSQAQKAPGIPNDAILVKPQTFAPDVAGMAAFTSINFKFENPGNVINLSVYDAQGRLVKDIAKNALVGTQGFFPWDGTRQNGSKAPVGYYMVLIKIIAPNGSVNLKKKQVAIGSHL